MGKWTYKRRKAIFTLFVGILVVLWFWQREIRIKKQIAVNEQVFFERFNESFWGEVYRIDLNILDNPRIPYKHVYIAVRQSSIKNYDYRDTTKNGYLVIQDSIAVLLEPNIRGYASFRGSYFGYDGKEDFAYSFDILSGEDKKYGRKLPFLSDSIRVKVYSSWKPRELFEITRQFSWKHIDLENINK